MNRYARILASLALVGATVACAPAADEPTSSADASASATTGPMSSMSMSVTPSGSPTPMASHDMGQMGSHDVGGSETVTVDIANFAFVPTRITIGAGTEVVFTNSDAAPHTATAGSDDRPTPEVFDSGLLQPGDAFSVVFDEPGTFAYFCERHPPMTGTIVVEG